MQFAFQTNQLEEMKAEGKETVLFRAQMLFDVYVYERDPLPSLDEFLDNPLRRPNGNHFWVYRQGTFLDAHIWRNIQLYAGEAFTAELDASQGPTVEGYHHVPTLFLDAGGEFNFAARHVYTPREQQEHLKTLYDFVRRNL